MAASDLKDSISIVSSDGLRGEKQGNIDYAHVEKDSEGVDRIIEKGVKKGNFDNPLEGLTHEELFTLVDQFTAENGLGHENEIMRKGALLAQKGHLNLRIFPSSLKRRRIASDLNATTSGVSP